jgi:hypothetical protein
LGFCASLITTILKIASQLQWIVCAVLTDVYLLLQHDYPWYFNLLAPEFGI